MTEMSSPKVSLTEKQKDLITLELRLKFFRLISWTSCPLWLKKTECRVFGEIICKLKGIKPHSNSKLIEAREETLRIMQAKNLNEYLKEKRL